MTTDPFDSPIKVFGTTEHALPVGDDLDCRVLSLRGQRFVRDFSNPKMTIAMFQDAMKRFDDMLTSEKFEVLFFLHLNWTQRKV